MNETSPRRGTGIPHWEADCARCSQEISDRMVKSGEMTRADALARPMWVCPECGNKRCAKASDHKDACTQGER